jgi:signal transduction histidine kinase
VFSWNGGRAMADDSQFGEGITQQEGHSVSVLPLKAKSPLSTYGIVFLCLAWAGLVGLFEYATGYAFHLTALFLVPICWADWAVGRRAGLLLAVVCTTISLATDLMTGHAYRHPVIPYWDALMLLAFFVVIVYALSGFQDAHRNLLVARSLLANQNELLEETVRQRTAALESEIAQRKRLEKAKLQAERLAMVGTMAAQVAHEVRNPLGSITLNLDLIFKEIGKLAKGNGHVPDEGRSLVNDMRSEVRRIQRVIDDYLQFARLPKLQRQLVDLNRFLEQKLGFLCGELERANVKLRTHFDPVLTNINADAEQLWQAVLNLIRNGREAMPNGGELNIGTWHDGEQALLRVSDNGKGMTEEQVQRVFEPFFTTKQEGTGLGLALVQQIVTEHGGHVECQSATGKGSTFTISLPLAEKS